MSPVCSQPFESIASEVLSGWLRYPSITNSERTSTSPSSAILIWHPGAGGPTVPILTWPGRLHVPAPQVSDFPHSSANSMPRAWKNSSTSTGVGAAPTPVEVLEFFHALGIELAELWGMSETCGAGTCNRPGQVKIGTVGPPAPGCQIKIAEDGEVLVRSEFVMLGYRNQPDKTSEAIDSNGWLHTGDIGELDEDGYLRLVDRKKELIINAAGKN